MRVHVAVNFAMGIHALFAKKIPIISVQYRQNVAPIIVKNICAPHTKDKIYLMEGERNEKI